MKKKSAELNTMLSDAVNLHSGETLTTVSRTGTLSKYLDMQCTPGIMEIVMAGRRYLSEDQGLHGNT